jgi:hypothetical protein
MGPKTFLRYPFKVTRGFFYINPPMYLQYDLLGPLRNAFDAGSIHYLGKWEGVGPWKSRVFEPQMALANWLDAIHRA